MLANIPKQKWTEILQLAVNFNMVSDRNIVAYYWLCIHNYSHTLYFLIGYNSE